MSDDTYTINVKGLDSLLKALKGKQPLARVGVMAKNHYAQLEPEQKQPSHIPTNDEVGAAHEYGAPARGLPQRSFLRVPISDKLQKYMESSGALDKDVMNDVLKLGSVLPWMKKIAALANQIVFDAFDSGGFGAWPKWKNPSYTNNAGMLLVDSTQLRGAIIHEVTDA